MDLWLILNPTAKAFATLRRDFSLRRLLVDYADVSTPNIIVRAFGSWVMSLLAFILLSSHQLPKAVASNFLRPKWHVERADVPRAFLKARPTPGNRGLYAPSQFRPRWLIKVTYNQPPSTQVEYELHVVECDDENEAKKIIEKGYIALSYAYKNAEDLFLELNPGITKDNIPPEPDAPLTTSDRLMTGWTQANNTCGQTQKRWREIAVRQRLAMVFLGLYLQTSFANRTSQSHFDGIEYIWLDEFCLYPPSRPDLGTRNEELGRMADIFSSASAVCVFCPRDDCLHVDETCDWGSRLWTLSEILHTDRVITLTKAKDCTASNQTYTLTSQPGRDFRAKMQHEAEAKGQWHLQAIMRHANNGGSTTWQHSIHALITEAIIRNQRGSYPNKLLAKALNGLLPRRAHANDLHGRDGWADLAWLLELNQGFYNSAALAAVCGLGESGMQGQGWLGPPVPPAAGNERLEPLVTAFPVPEGLFLMRPRIIGLRSKLTRDLLGLYHNKELFPIQVIAVLGSVVAFFSIPISLIFMLISRAAGNFALTSCMALFLFSFLINFIGMTLYIERDGIILLPDAEDTKSAAAHMGERDKKLSELKDWGDDQLVPTWKSSLEEGQVKKATFVELAAGVSISFLMRRSGKKLPNALVPLAIHGCGITCLVLHHHDDPFEPAIKLGIVNMPPYISVFGEEVGSLVVANSVE
ncbi:hypothetical protein CPB86DRAFT_721520 [Serendipita vermifera]|nr:hypothetical protein CPB86DRAFT_721520 [Serendipita vermifera]